jgi:hypothetical protein
MHTPVMENLSSAKTVIELDRGPIWEPMFALDH